MPGLHALIKAANIKPFGAHEVSQPCFVLILDAMLPRQRLRISRTDNRQMFDFVYQVLVRWKRFNTEEGGRLKTRLCMVGRHPRSQNEARPGLPSPNPCGVEVLVEGMDDINVEGGLHACNDMTFTLVGGRPFELLELVRFNTDADVRPEFDPRVVWNTLEGNAMYFLARVRWQPLMRLSNAQLDRMLCTSTPVNNGTDLRRLVDMISGRFRDWAACVRRGRCEKFHGQLEQILADIGPCPSMQEPDAACFWLAALLNPLPALGVAPEIRGHVLAKSSWAERLECVRTALDASLENCARSAQLASPGWDRIPSEDDIDVCRVQ